MIVFVLLSLNASPPKDVLRSSTDAVLFMLIDGHIMLLFCIYVSLKVWYSRIVFEDVISN